MTKSTRRFRSSARLALAALGVAAGALLGSCNIVTPVAYAIDGPGKIDAEFNLPNKKTVVFVDDPLNILPRTALRTAIGDAVSFDLMQREILTATVATRDAIAVSRTGAGANANKLLSIEAIARALDASQVIYIRPTIFDVAGRSDTQGIRPTASVRVKVIDVDTKERVYPGADVMHEGREVTASVRESDTSVLRTRAGRTQVEDALAKKVAVEVGQLFYEHDRIDLGENLGTRKR